MLLEILIWKVIPLASVLCVIIASTYSKVSLISKEFLFKRIPSTESILAKS